MKLLTKDVRDKLLRNGRITAALAEEGKASAAATAIRKQCSLRICPMQLSEGCMHRNR